MQVAAAGALRERVRACEAALTGALAARGEVEADAALSLADTLGYGRREDAAGVEWAANPMARMSRKKSEPELMAKVPVAGVESVAAVRALQAEMVAARAGLAAAVAALDLEQLDEALKVGSWQREGRGSGGAG